MDSKLKNATRKRKHDEDISNEYKRKKLETPEIPEEGDGVTKITDVIDDCLERIFGYLNLQDLINIAETCKRFQSSVKLAFATKFKGKVMWLFPKNFNLKKSFQPIKLIGNTIEINNLLNCLKILRHFGSMITKLDVNYSHLIRNQSAVLARYTNEYCADSLIGINIYGGTELVMANWTKPFSNVESIKFSQFKLRNVNKWFPKMRRLVLGADSQIITNNFPHLEELKIMISSHDIEYQTGTKKKIKEILRLNSQLQKLYWPYFVNIKFMASASQYLQSLRFLDIYYDYTSDVGVSPIHLKNVEEFHVEISTYSLKYSSYYPMPKFPFSFDRLEKLQLAVGTEMIRRIDNLMNFIRQNPSLVKLTICVKHFNTLDAEQVKMTLSTEFEWLDVEVKQFTYVPARAPISLDFWHCDNTS